MITNATVPENSKLHTAAKALLDAGYDYWREYKKQYGACAVVWLEADNGHFILFTRSEYKGDILSRVPIITGDPGMEHPFGDDTLSQQP